MTVGFVVDGQAEALAYPRLFARLKVDGVTFINPLYADMQPKATPAQIVKAAASRLKLAMSRGAERQVLLIDFENRDDCPPAFADAINQTLQEFGFVKATAVVKKQCFENWLIADPQALGQMRARFDIEEGFHKLVCNTGADNISAQACLEKCCKKFGYNKRVDPVHILEKVSPEVMAINSRSFRRFLRVIGHPLYSNQSRRAA